MAKKDPRIDDYIAKSADFAKPILTEIRAVVHDVCPNVEETMKWSFPHFDYKGMMCSMAAFKEHCAFGFWKASLILDGNGRSEEAMGQFGRITDPFRPALEEGDARLHPKGDGAQRERDDGQA